MKVSSTILLVTFLLLVTALFASNLLLKKEYDKIDKSDIYWTYGSILEEPFKHLVIEGGNITNIAFEPSKKSSIRVFKMWDGFENKAVKASVKNDTLFVSFPQDVKDAGLKRYMSWKTMVRIFSPELLSVNGHNTNFGMYKMKQKSIDINLSGKSKLEVESYLNTFDSLHIAQRDSSQVVFEMSPDLMGTKAPQKAIPNEHVQIRSETGKDNIVVLDETPTSWETMYVKSVDADIKGASLLDIGHAQITNLHLNITDTSGIILSGGSLRRFKK
ncbi:MAG TPA: hypothetical protein VLJ41_09795 [Segetibacter sp.]|nr:hypothetical protein [Segetibacter sp.]